MIGAGENAIMRTLFACLILTLAALGNPAIAQEHPVFTTKIEPPQLPMLFDMLKGGGFVIFFRHAGTPDYMEPEPIDFTSCARQRNLNPRGREQAFRIGQAFRELGIPVGEVIASPFCRTMDTARLAFGRVEMAEEARDKDRRDKLVARAAAARADGTNLIVVGHGSAAGLIGEEFLREAEAAILRPLDDGKFQPVARMQVDQWEQMLPRNRIPPPGTPRAP